MKANARFINTEKIEGYVYSTGSNFNQLECDYHSLYLCNRNLQEWSD